MRFFWTAFILLFSVTLFAQRTKPLGKGWQLSIELGIDPTTERVYTPYVTAADTLPFDRLFPRSTVETSLSGNTVTYYSEPALERVGNLEKALINFLPTIKLHYRMDNNVEFGAGLFYTTQKENQRVEFDGGLPGNYLVQTSDFTTWHAGFRTDAVYNFFPGKRVQPYAGLQLDLGIRQSNFITSYNILPGLGSEEEVDPLLNRRFQKNTLLDFDLDLLLGVNYRLSDRFAVGLVGHLGRYLLPERLAALQVRYLFTPRQRQ